METQLCIGIGLIVGFVMGLFIAGLMFKKKDDIMSCLVKFVIYGKKIGKSNEGNEGHDHSL